MPSSDVSVRVEPTTPGDLDAIARLLAAAFDAPADASFVDRRLLAWKYLERAGSRVPRSYVLRKGADIVAHCAVSPLAIRVPGAPRAVSAYCFMDWAAGRQLPGAGLILMKALMGQSDVGIVAGGSAATRAIIPKLGFRVAGAIEVRARVVRPLAQARARPRTTAWKDAARLVRNAAWSLASRGTPPPGWRAEAVPAVTGVPRIGLPGVSAPERDSEFLEYWRRCPGAKVSIFALHQADEPAGYCVVSRVAGQARIADLRIASPAAADWAAAYRIAADAAADDTRVHEVTCVASVGAAREALAASGFRARGSTPFYLSDPRGVLTAAPPVFWSMIDDDTACVHDPANPYAT